MSRQASKLLTTRLEQLRAQFVGLPRCPHTRASISKAVRDEIGQLERLIGSPHPFTNNSRIRGIIQARIDGHNN